MTITREQAADHLSFVNYACTMLGADGTDLTPP